MLPDPDDKKLALHAQDEAPAVDVEPAWQPVQTSPAPYPICMKLFVQVQVYAPTFEELFEGQITQDDDVVL